MPAAAERPSDPGTITGELIALEPRQEPAARRCVPGSTARGFAANHAREARQDEAEIHDGSKARRYCDIASCMRRIASHIF